MLGDITVSVFPVYDADWIGRAGDNMIWHYKASGSRADVVHQRLQLKCSVRICLINYDGNGTLTMSNFAQIIEVGCREVLIAHKHVYIGVRQRIGGRIDHFEIPHDGSQRLARGARASIDGES